MPPSALRIRIAVGAALAAVVLAGGARPAGAQVGPSPRLVEPVLDGGRLVYPEGAAIPRTLTEIERRVPVLPRGIGSTTGPPVGPLHCAAEYEPTEAIIVAWEGDPSWRDVLAFMAARITTIGDADVHVICDSGLDRANAESVLLAAGADPARLMYFTIATDTIWMRDYGPRYVFEGDVRVIVDHTYNRLSRTADNDMPILYSAFRRHLLHDLPLVHGGGNFHLTADALGYATRLISNENPDLTDVQIRDLWRDYQGLDTAIVEALPASVDATQHVDMWMLPLSDTVALVSDWPFDAGTPQDLACDAGAALLESRGVTVHRIPARNVRRTHYTYTNAVIVNDLILMPGYTEPTVSPWNDDALAIYEAAAPGKTIVQVPAQDIVTAAGVLHCVVMHVPRARGGGWPTVHLRTRPGCEGLEAGSSAEIRWVSDDDLGTVEADVLLSTDGGRTWPDVIAAGIPDTGSFTWDVPMIETATARLRVVVRDADANEGLHDSEADFRIGPPVAVVEPDAPPLLLVAKAGTEGELDLDIALSARAEAWSVYSGAIGSFAAASSAECHGIMGDPALRAPDGDSVAWRLAPPGGSHWYLVSAANCAGESLVRIPLASGSCGPSTR